MKVASVVLLAAWILPATALASPHDYANPAGMGDVLILCTHDLTGGPDLGGVCIPAGHIPDDFGFAVLQITDDFVAPASGFYCQDHDGDQICGETAGLAAGTGQVPLVPAELRGQTVCKIPLVCDITEHQQHFCGATAITKGVDWEPSLDVFVFIDGLVYGNPLTSPCGSFSAGTHGFVDHSP